MASGLLKVVAAAQLPGSGSIGLVSQRRVVRAVRTAEEIAAEAEVTAYRKDSSAPCRFGETDVV